MKSSVPRRIVGCIGKCTSGLTLEELDHVTDHVHKALTHLQGRKIFKEYLRQARRSDDLDCLDFYEKCCEYIEKEHNYHRTEENPTLAFLIEDVNEAMMRAEDLDGVPEIDMALLERYNETMTTPTSRDALLSILEETKLRLTNHLRNAHRSFRTYALAPCPRNT